MSNDIRSYFSVLSSSKGKVSNAPEKKQTATRKRKDKTVTTSPLTKTKKRKTVIIDSDSEDDVVMIVEKEVKLKPTDAKQVFDTCPIKQSPIVKRTRTINVETETVKQKKKKTSKNIPENTITELGIHDDPEFEQTLLELDEEMLSNLKENKPNESPVNKTKKEKTKTEVSPILNETVDEHEQVETQEEKHEKRRQSAILYQQYLNRSGPPNHGVKKYPKGTPNCLLNFCFIRTGVLDSLEGAEFEDLIKQHGGRVVHSVSKKVNYVVVGEDPGPAKLEKAKQYGIETISEDQLLDLILVKSGKEPTYVKAETIESVDTPLVDTPTTSLPPPTQKPVKTKVVEHEPIADENLSWADKYKPANVKAIIGQQGDKSCMSKLMNWLKNWHKYHSGSNRPKLTRPSLWSKDDNGAYFKAALLSGPPGIGKTTTATLVAKELGFDVVEFNASDTRNKKLLHEEISKLVGSKSVASFINDGASPTSKHVLLMDEVDGMAGNEDRGGIQELIALIKKSNIPIICMCNDRNHQKIRSLVNYCFDLKFPRPRVEQIKGAMMSVCFKEGVKITPDALTEIISGSGMDIRQTLTHLSMWSAVNKSVSLDTARTESKTASKDPVIGPWDVCRKVFSESEHKTMSFADKSRLFYYDYSIGPLFVQENYLRVVPHSKEQALTCAAKAADSLSLGDITDSMIRRSNNWSLLEVEAMFCSVIPGFHMEGHMGGQIEFPSWLGKNSKKNKLKRLQSELHSHMRISTSGSRTAINLDYLSVLRNAIVQPLIKDGLDGISTAVDTMKQYSLTREDFDSIFELGQWPNQKNLSLMIDSKVKAAFTRSYNKQAAKLPYSISNLVTKKKAAKQDEELLDEENEDENSEDEDKVDNDGMIKIKKPSVPKKQREEKASTTKNKNTGSRRKKLGG